MKIEDKERRANGEIFTQEPLELSYLFTESASETLSIKSTHSISHASAKGNALKAVKSIILTAPLINLFNLYVTTQCIEIKDPTSSSKLVFMLQKGIPACLDIAINFTNKIPTGTITILGGRSMSLHIIPGS
jgi:hypothetical protein